MFALVRFLAVLAAITPVSLVPLRIASPTPSTPPLWIRADAAFTPAGDLVPDFGEATLPLERYVADQRRSAGKNRHSRSESIAAADLPCHDRYLSLPIEEDFRPTRTVDELLANSQSLLLGRIIDSAAGFYRGTPGTLFVVDVERAVPSDGALTRVRIFFPYARIVRGDRAFCSNPIGTAMRPATGDRLLLFDTYGPSDGDATFAPDPRSALALQTSGGETFLPQALQSADYRGLTLEQLVSRLAARATAAGHLRDTARH